MDLRGYEKFKVEAVYLRRWDGSTYPADLAHGQLTRDPANGRTTRNWNWGAVSVSWAFRENRAGINVEISNTGQDTIVALHLRLADVHFPQTTEPRNVMFRTPWMRSAESARMAHNIGEPSIIVAEFGSRILAVCNEDVGRPLAVGFGPPNDRDKRSWPLMVYTGRHPVLPKSFPFVDRPIYPGQTDRFRLSLRQGPPGTDPNQMAADIYGRFAAACPFKLKWEDRRPIGQIFLSRSDAGWRTNPRGYLNSPEVDVTTEDGRKRFREQLLAYADGCIRIMKQMDAQGVIVWDIEGQENKHPTSYLGDARSLPPEMEAVADDFFKRFTDAGFKVGVTVRPQMPVRRPYGNEVFQQTVADPVQNLVDKIAYARKRWGCSIFYLDSDVFWVSDPVVLADERGASLLIGADELRRVQEAHPDVLLIPEIEDVQKYAYGAPYLQLNYDKLPATPPEVLRAYPGAFSAISVVDSKLDEFRAELVKAVRRGDILFYRTWFADSWNKEIKAIYEEAKRPTGGAS